MSYQIGIDTIHLRATARLAHTEYCSHEKLAAAFNDAWDIDFIWTTNDGPLDWAQCGRTTDMGHAEFLEGGTDFRAPKTCPFQTPDDVWAFDAVQEYGLPDFDDLVTFYNNAHQQLCRDNPRQVVPGGYYKTIISGAIDAFGWDMLLLAASDLIKFEKVLDSFFRRTMHHVKAWAQTDIEVFLQHDDFVWSAGPFMDPAFYRSAIIPRYAELWKVLRAAGKRILFCADADWSMFVGDIAGAGADGFIFEPMLPLKPVVEQFGKTHVIVASEVDCRTLTFGSPETIAREIDATLAMAMDCPGFMFAVGNHIPSNVPIDNALFYFDYLKKRWSR